jgi:lipase chaperone LimK
MDQRDSHCPYLMYCEPTAKGTGLGNAAGKEDPVELDSSEIKVFVCKSKQGGRNCKTTDLFDEYVNYLMGSLAGAARLLNNNADVQR